MAKLTFTIPGCKIHEVKTPFVNKASGKMTWETDGFIFEKWFDVKSSEVVDMLKENKHMDITFKAQGYLFKTPGFGKCAGKILEKYMVTKLEVMA